MVSFLGVPLIMIIVPEPVEGFGFRLYRGVGFREGLKGVGLRTNTR